MGKSIEKPMVTAIEQHSDALAVPENSTGKSAEKSVNGRPFVAGYDPRRGNGPKPGAPNAGRPPDEFYEWLDGAVNNPKVRERYEAILGQGDPDLFLKALKWGDERLRGKPSQSIEHGGTATVILKAVRE
jgi:hypothetical protein